MQSSIMPSSFGRNLLLGEGEVVVGCDVDDNPLEAFYGDVLGHMGLVQNLNQQCSVRLRAHE